MRKASILQSRFSFPLLGLALLAFVQCDGDDDDGGGAGARAGQAGASGAAGAGARAGRSGSAGSSGASAGTPAMGGGGSGGEAPGQAGETSAGAGVGHGGETNGGAAGAGGENTSGAAGQGGEGGEGGDAFSRSEPVHGRIYAAVREDPNPGLDSGYVGAAFYDQALRMDAFAAFPPELHERSLEGGDCILFTAAALQCNPPCGSEQYCGTGNQCRAMAALVPAGVVTITGLGPGLSLTPDMGTYPHTAFPAAQLTAAKTVTVQSAGGATPAFSLSAPGVSRAAFDLPGDWSIQLVDGEDYALTWTGAANATVRLLLNSGWHGAPPDASLLCEAPGSAGRITIPAELVEAYPPAGGVGLFPHQSWVSVLQRSKTVVGGRTVELVVSRDRLVQPIHNAEP